MMTYLVLNIVFLATLLFFAPDRAKRPSRAWWLTLAAVTGLTLIFDPIIIALDIVDYDPSKILGIRWFGAPIEDLFYALYAVCVIPMIWERGKERHARKS